MGVELGAHGQQLMGKQVERLGRALQRLSLELCPHNYPLRQTV